jgi:hypothetical protein
MEWLLRTAMDINPVVSSNILSIRYDGDSKTLEIEFNKGGVYQYYDVPLAEYEGLMSAESIGSYFYHNIRNGGYRSEKV